MPFRKYLYFLDTLNKNSLNKKDAQGQFGGRKRKAVKILSLTPNLKSEFFNFQTLKISGFYVMQGGGESNIFLRFPLR